VVLVGFQVPVTPPAGTHPGGDDLGERVKVHEAGGEVKVTAVSRRPGAVAAVALRARPPPSLSQYCQGRASR
jgi:hypothetical protein